jgi:hypothetical protein
VRPPFRCSAAELGRAIRLALEATETPGLANTPESPERKRRDLSNGPESPERKRRDLPDGPLETPLSAAPITPATWGTGLYSPTPTIIEAARSLYARHTVHDITRSDAGAAGHSPAGGAAVDPPAAAGHGAGGARGLLIGESGSSPKRSTFG